MALKRDVWLYFEDVGNAVAKCKICQKMYSYKATADLRLHLERKHDDLPSTGPHQLFVSSTTLTTEDLLSDSSLIIIPGTTVSENSDTDTQNNSQTANNTESSDIEPCPVAVQEVSLLDEVAKDRSPPRQRSRRRMKRPSLRGSRLVARTDDDFGRLIAKKMQFLPFALRCGLEVEILRLVNSELNKVDQL